MDYCLLAAKHLNKQHGSPFCFNSTHILWGQESRKRAQEHLKFPGSLSEDSRAFLLCFLLIKVRFFRTVMKCLWSYCTSLPCNGSSFKGQVVSGQASVAITTSSFSPEVWIFVKGSRVRLLASASDTKRDQLLSVSCITVLHVEVLGKISTFILTNKLWHYLKKFLLLQWSSFQTILAKRVRGNYISYVCWFLLLHCCKTYPAKASK